MTFPAVVVYSLTEFFLMSAVSSLFCMFFGKIFRKNYLKCRFSLFCIMLTFAFAVFSVDLIFFKNFLSFPHAFLSNYIFFSVVAVISILLTCFWKISIPVFLASYLTVCFYTKNFLESETCAIDQSISFSVDSDEAADIAVKVYTVPPEFLFPVSRNWFTVQTPSPQNMTDPSPSAGNRPGIFLKIDSFLNNLLLSDYQEVPAQLPLTEGFFPMIFSIRLERNSSGYATLVTREL